MIRFNDLALAFEDLSKDMNIPALRRKLTRENIRWLLRNLAIQNGSHPNFVQVINLVKQMNGVLNSLKLERDV
jgi:hypothetical protein